MKRLNKILLAGAALTGVVSAESRAWIDIDAKKLIKNLMNPTVKKSEEAKAWKDKWHIQLATVREELRQQYPVDLDGFVYRRNDLDGNKLKVALLTVLAECLKLPVIKESLNIYKKRKKENYTFIFNEGYETEDQTTVASTGPKDCEFFRKAIEDRKKEQVDYSGYGWSENIGRALAYKHNEEYAWLDEPDNRDFSTEYACIRTAPDLLHELGHFVHLVQGTEWKNTTKNKKFKDFYYSDIWLTKFNKLYNPSQDPKFRTTKYGRTDTSEGFAEDFCRSAWPGNNYGGANDSKKFEEALDKITGIPHCLTPIKNYAREIDYSSSLQRLFG